MNEIIFVGVVLLILAPFVFMIVMALRPATEQSEPKAQTPLTWQQLVTILGVIAVLGVVGYTAKGVIDANRATDEFHDRRVACMTVNDVIDCLGQP